MSDALARLAAQAPPRRPMNPSTDPAELLARILSVEPAPGPVPARRGARRLRVAVAGLAPVAILAAVVTLATTSGDGAQAAYAVQPRSDGSVTVVVYHLRDAQGLQRELQAAGVPAVVDYDLRHAAYTCPDDPAGQAGASPGPATGAPASGSQPATPAGAAAGEATAEAFTVRPGQLGPGQKVYITSADGKVGSIGFAVTDDPAHICGIPAPPRAPRAGG